VGNISAKWKRPPQGRAGKHVLEELSEERSSGFHIAPRIKFPFALVNIKITCTFFFFLDKFLYVAPNGLELLILLSQSPECWDYRLAPLYLNIF
jgi:hypothetical protein